MRRQQWGKIGSSLQRGKADRLCCRCFDELVPCFGKDSWRNSVPSCMSLKHRLRFDDKSLFSKAAREWHPGVVHSPLSREFLRPKIRFSIYPEPRGPRVLRVGELVLWYGMFAPCGRLYETMDFARGAPFLLHSTWGLERLVWVVSNPLVIWHLDPEVWNYTG